MNQVPLRIRAGSPQDIHALLALVHDCVEAMRAAGIEQWDEVYPNLEIIKEDITAGTLDVLCEDDNIIGCITVDAKLDPMWQDLNWSFESERASAVHRLMIHPSKQGLGHAKRLMLHAEAVAQTKGSRSIWLDSFLQNPAAMALYAKLGYRQTGTAMMRKGEFSGFEKPIQSP